MKIGVLCFTTAGRELGERLVQFLCKSGHEAAASVCADGELGKWTAERFGTNGALIFIGAAGIAVRAVAPYISSKTTDPAVIVIDEKGRFVIPVLSGHIGGGNRLACEIAFGLDAVPVITTATDTQGVFAIDTWASENGIAIINPERIKLVSSKLLRGETVTLASGFKISGTLPRGIALADFDAADIIITDRQTGITDALMLMPPVLVLGIGCRRGTPVGEIKAAFAQFMSETGYHESAIGLIASVDLKASEPGITEFCNDRGLPFITFSAEELCSVPGEFTSSEFVKTIVGTENVCERAAVYAAGTGAEIAVRKTVLGGITMALSRMEYSVRFTEG